MHLQPAALDLELVERIPLRLNVDDFKVADLPNLKRIIVHSVDALARMRSANHLARCAWHADSQALKHSLTQFLASIPLRSSLAMTPHPITPSTMRCIFASAGVQNAFNRL
jgi:hypothetical protein